MIDKIVSVLKGILRLDQAVESILIDLISAISPWLAPILPAYLTGSNLFYILNYPWQISIIVALVIETIGLSSMSTILLLWTFNETKREKDASAPVGLAIIAGVIYISVVLSVNVLLEINPQEYKIVVNGLMSLMTVVAALIIAVRGQHARKLENIITERQERKAERYGRINLPERSGKLPERSEMDWRQVSITDRDAIAEMPTSLVSTNFGVSDRTARNWVRKAKNNGFHKIEKEEENA